MLQFCDKKFSTRVARRSSARRLTVVFVYEELRNVTLCAVLHTLRGSTRIYTHTHTHIHKESPVDVPCEQPPPGVGKGWSNSERHQLGQYWRPCPSLTPLSSPNSPLVDVLVSPAPRSRGYAKENGRSCVDFWEWGERRTANQSQREENTGRYSLVDRLGLIFCSESFVQVESRCRGTVETWNQ